MSTSPDEPADPDPDLPRGPGRRSSALWSATLPWVWLAVLIAASSALLALVGLPSPLLFGAVIGGLVLAISRLPDPDPPGWLFALGQALIGVTVGAGIDWSSLASLGWDWPAVLAVSIATVVLSVAAGQLLRLGRVDAVTSAFSSVAGGASGMTALSRDLGADDRIVTVVQYLRVLVILLAMPAVVSLVFTDGGSSASSGESSSPFWTGLALVVIAVVVGPRLGRLVRLPSPALLGTIVVTIALTFLPVFDGVSTPAIAEAAGFVLVGAQVGLRFTPASLAAIGRLLPLTLVVILVIVGGCAGLGVALAAVTGVTELDAYLATTPGGLYAVLATATSTGADTTFVTAVQVLRLLLVLFSAPLVARLLTRRPAP